MFFDLTIGQKLILLKKLTGGGGSIQTLTGDLPQTISNALAKAIRSLTQYGLCTQDGTPTPDNPVDIVCNNGTLKMRHRSGLPTGYKLLEYVGGSGSQYVITDTYLASTDIIECEYKNSSTTGYGAVYGIYKTGESTALYGNQTYYGYDQANNKVDTGMSVDTEWHSARHDFVNGTLTIDDTTTTFTPWAFTNTTKNAVLSRFYNGSYGYNWKGFVRKFKVMRGNEVICDLLPAKNSNDVAGLYDLISGDFYTATGGTLLEGDVVDDYELIVDGTPEVLSLGGKNLVNITAADIEQGAISSADGSNSGSASHRVRTIGYYPVKPNTQYTISCVIDGYTSGSSKGVFILEYSSDSVSGYTGDSSGWKSPDGYTFTTGASTNFIRIVFAAGASSSTPTVPEDVSNVQLEYGETATTYEPYRTPQTASVADLFAVGNSKDTHELIGGTVKRNVGIKVFDGTETFSTSTAYGKAFLINAASAAWGADRTGSVLCTHFLGLPQSAGSQADNTCFFNQTGHFYFRVTDNSDTAAFKAWLKAQYDNGTPVIVLYPLAEETTESVTAQSLRTEKGNNVVSATAEVSPVSVEIEYTGS